MPQNPADRAAATDSRFWQVELDCQARADGSFLIRQKGELPPGPPRLSDRIAEWAARAPDRVWMAERRGPEGDWHRIDYATLHRSVRSIGQFLLDLGLSVDRPLLILSDNSLAHGLMALGAQYAGIASAAIAPAYSLSGGSYEKLAGILAQITPGAIFAEDLAAFEPALAATQTAGIPRLAAGGAGADHLLDAILRTEPRQSVELANLATGPDSIAKFLFTSGTTGNPKAVITTQGMLCANMAQAADCFAFLKVEPPVLVDWAPWNHVASGNKVFNMAIWNGGTFYIDKGRPGGPKMAETLRNLAEISPTWFFNVPVGYEMMVEAMQADRALADRFFARLRIMFYAGAGMGQHTWTALQELAIRSTGAPVPLGTGLGATETSPFAMFCTMPQEKPGNIGVPAKGMVLKLVPSEDKLEARLKGPNVSPGYWRDPDLTAAAFDDEGFYRLGDALRFAVPGDPAAGFYFDGRVAENFKLTTGTWVAVGNLRAALVDALGGLARDVVLAGEGEAEIAALILPFRPALERLVPDGAALDIESLCARPEVRDAIAAGLAAHNARATGSSLRVPRAMLLTAPLDLDRGEVTDKGSVNQRAVLRHRAEAVRALYGEGTGVIHAKAAPGR